MWLLVVAGLAFAGGLDWPVDLDGDGKKESAVYPEATEENQDADDLFVQVGKAKIPYHFVFPSSIEPIDLKQGDGVVELMVCVSGPRDDSECTLYRYLKGAITPIKSPISALVSMYTASGSGIVLAHSNESRLFTRIDKSILQSDGTLQEIPQPYYRVDKTIRIDRMFPVTMNPNGGDVVANVRPGSQVKALVTDGQGNFLLELSSGLIGWASYAVLQQASDYIQMMESAG